MSDVRPTRPQRLPTTMARIALVLSVGGASAFGCAVIAGLDQEYVVGDVGVAGTGGGGEHVVDGHEHR